MKFSLFRFLSTEKAQEIETSAQIFLAWILDIWIPQERWKGERAMPQELERPSTAFLSFQSAGVAPGKAPSSCAKSLVFGELGGCKRTHYYIMVCHEKCFVRKWENRSHGVIEIKDTVLPMSADTCLQRPRDKPKAGNKSLVSCSFSSYICELSVPF